jgi:hypothetical protein
MTTENGIEIARIVLDFLKSIFPFGLLFLLFLIFKKEVSTLIKNGGLKVTAPGVSIETLQKQQVNVSQKERKEIKSLNIELKTAQQREQKLKELQEYTNRDKDTFFLGYHFEKTYRLIFPSQMVILDIINNSAEKEISNAVAQSFFRRTVWAIQFQVNYNQFMGFLVQSGLVSYDADKESFLITHLGTTFWQYLKTNNMHLKMPANDFIVSSDLSQNGGQH